jgi:hypothetical protein
LLCPLVRLTEGARLFTTFRSQRLLLELRRSANPTRSIIFLLPQQPAQDLGVHSGFRWRPNHHRHSDRRWGFRYTRRIMLRSSAVGTTRTLTVGTLSADDCDFRDITIAGTAAGGSPTRAGDCGGNSGVTFPAPKTVYWNLAGSQNWSATAWATTSGGTACY